MPDTPSRNPYVSAASAIIFGDEEFAHQDFMQSQLDDKFRHPSEERFVTVNGLAAELEAAV
jgi:hypothetical protein